MMQIVVYNEVYQRATGCEPELLQQPLNSRGRTRVKIKQAPGISLINTCNYFTFRTGNNVTRPGTTGRDAPKKADPLIREQQQKRTNQSGRGMPPKPQRTYDRIRDYLRDRNLLSLYGVAQPLANFEKLDKHHWLSS